MKECPHCKQMNADWARECGRCGKPLHFFTPLDLDDAFDGYMRKVNPTVAQHSAQYKESRRCFMAGVALLYFHQTGAMLDLPESQSVIELESIGEQLVEFKLRVAEERD